MIKQPLKIAIPNACNQNYMAMDHKADGKFCSNCSNIIIDFSEMTDVELIRYFKKYPATHCGRFHVSQLSRKIETISIRNNLFSYFSKIAAGLVALSTLKFSSAKANYKNVNSISWQQNKNKKVQNTYTDTATISGIITNNKMEPLQNVAISFNGVQVATTDKNGHYSFTLKEAKEGNLYFNCDKYNANVRNYHPVMGNTIYNVVLNEHGEESNGTHTMGIIMPFLDMDALPAVTFVNDRTTKFSILAKEQLSFCATKLKQNPTANIILQGQSSNATTVLIHNRLQKIKKYLVQSKGISEDRINTNVQLSEFSNTIVITPSNE
jgi:hypothetical protein